MTLIVLDASAGVEIALQTPIGRRLQAKLPAGADTWVPEHYFAETTAVLRRDEIKVVSFKTAGRYQLAEPSWYPITDDTLTALVGTDVDPSRGEGFVPSPSPVAILVYEIWPVWKLPRPKPFRQPACMPSSGPSWLQRMRRQLRPGRGPQGCCWYHDVDWAKVSGAAVRFVAAALNHGTQPDDIEDFVMDQARAAKMPARDLAALRTLVSPVESICLDQEDRSVWYINGQHRAQAMIDAGVRRTVIVKQWEEMPDS